MALFFTKDFYLIHYFEKIKSKILISREVLYAVI